MSNNESKIPTIKISALAPTGSGKTVLGSTMMMVLQRGIQGVTLRAVDDAQHIEQLNIFERIILNNTWPDGTDVDVTSFLYEVSLHGEPFARIDWVDYRGGDIEKPFNPNTNDSTFKLMARLRESNAIILMIDLSRLVNFQDAPDDFVSFLHTKLMRLKQLCSTAIHNNPFPPSIIIVGNQAHAIQQQDGTPDWRKATELLKSHTGDIDHPKDYNRIAFLPISAVGRSYEDKRLFGDKPAFVEWAIFLPLLFEYRLLQSKTEDERERQLIAQQKSKPGFIRQKLREKTPFFQPSLVEIETEERILELNSALYRIEDTMETLRKEIPDFFIVPDYLRSND